MCSYAALDWSRDYFYREFRFADIFSAARRVPDSMLPRIQEISGVAAVETRLVYDVLLDLPEMREPATARLISMPESGRSLLNQVYISRGRMLEPRRTGEVVISEVFAEAHGFVAGDTVRAIINGKSQQLTIVGVALSPEYVIQVQPGSIVPDTKRFGVFWMNQRDLEAALDMTGAFNSVSLKLAYDNNPDEIITQLDRLLEPYGSAGAFPRDQQLSHQYLSDELRQLRGMAVMAPAIFLSVAAFLLNMVTARIVSQQREQIAALKAFGYGNTEVGLHYLNLVLLITLAGTVVGTLLGFWMAANITELYQKFYRFPLLEFRVDRLAVVSVFLITTLAAVCGTWFSVREAIRLPPAEAMRPEAPASYRLSLLERLPPRHLFTPELRMVVLPSDPAILDARARAEAGARVRGSEAALQRAESSLEQAKINHELSVAKYQRATSLLPAQAISRDEFELIETDYRATAQAIKTATFDTEIARFELDMARAALLQFTDAQADTSVAPFEIHAPISGRVLRVFEESSTVVAVGAPLVELGDPGDLEMEIDVLSTDAVRIRPGAELTVEHWGGGAPLQGHMRIVEPSAFTKISSLGVEEQRVNVIADFHERPERLATLGDGYRIEARITIEELNQALLIPNSALFRHQRKWHVLSILAGQATLQAVSIGLQNETHTQILEGLQLGDRVIVYPSGALTPGTPVRLSSPQ